ncbi:MAG: PAS domain S-box protein [Deltaproteobacteria bacterium]|nr:PAS domain S-box protein [Deltaproteobacteria bacterium]
MQGKDSEVKLFSAFDYVPFGVFIIDSAFTVLFWNRCLEEWTGVARSEIENNHIGDHYPHFNKKIYANRIEGIFEFGPPLIFSSQLHRHLIPSPMENGNLRIQQTTVTSIPSLDNKEAYALFAIHDVTDETRRIMDYRKMRDRAITEVEERKKAEDALKKSEEKFSLHVQQTPLGVIRWNTDFVVTAWNPAAEKIFGYADKEAIGKDARQIIIPLSKSKEAGKVWSELIENKESTLRRSENVTKDGRTILCEWHNTPLIDNSGKVIAVASFVQNVTDQVEAEELIKRNHLEEEILNYLLSLSLEDISYNELLDRCLDEILSIPFIPLKSSGAIFVVEKEGEILRMISHRGLGARLLELCKEDLPFDQCLCGRAIADEETVFTDCNNDRHNIRYEEIKPHAHYCIPIKSKKEVLGVINLYLDEGAKRDENDIEFLETIAATLAGILERRKIEEALRQAKEVAEEANRLKDKFVSLVSHDLKNPIYRIAGYLDLIEASQQISDQGKDMIEEGKIACNDMTSLINEILNMNRIRGGIMHPNYSFVHADKIAQQAIRNYAILAREKGITLKSSLPSDFRLYGDKRLILEVFRNLISNGVKFCNRGDSIDIYIPQGESSVIAVSDTGIGIEKSRMEALFKYDEKSSTRGTSDEGGSGLGLPLSHDIMISHYGDLTVSSSPANGTTFYMNFPHIKPSIMIVDDDESMRDLLKGRLEKMDVSFIEAGNGEEAIQCLERALPHLIFIDTHMPGMSGLELLERLRNIPDTEKTPVIVVSVDKSMEAMDGFTQLGADDFIEKTFDKDELSSIVSRFIC